MHLSAVSYLNTRPLVWGFLNGPQQGLAQVDFDLPSVCARRLASREVDAGLVPVVEAARLHLAQIGSLGIACRGPVRSILLLSKVPIRDIRTLALDSSSRSSVMLARIVLERGYQLEPNTLTMVPDLPAMLGRADAALIIGDPALRIDPASSGLHVLDLGEEWLKLTGLPMVFAIWAGPKQNPELAALLQASYDYGKTRLNEIVLAEAAERSLWPGLAYEYLNSLIQFEIVDDYKRGMKLYIEEAMRMEGKQLA
ncbi:menaquinone biosynthetic enzyme MqnA/MqnD family protein [Bryobacter aggregatus]|uniref:menaquinone biosynthetic enzyme MqnA/MqnD family protein n=1 Tax=Bryobacter aggregatus TaxID=360054 RepID=UPI0006907220|nr:menaquinone biosynthesis protein [Bryobacter aggregatus]